MEENNINAAIADQEEVFSLTEFLSQCMAKWKWFAASILLFCCIGVFYIMRQQPVYSRSMAVLIKDQDGGGSVADLSSAFSSMGLVSSNTNVNNELISLTSPAVMYEVIKRLSLDVNYLKDGTFHGTTLYGKNLPFNVLFADLEEQEGAQFKMYYDPSGKIRLYEFVGYDEAGNKIKSDKSIEARIDGSAVKTPIGRLVFTPNPTYEAPKKGDKPCEITVWRTGMQNSVEYYSKMLKGDLADKEADVIDLSIKDVSPQRAVDILNMVVEVYNESWAEDKNKIAVATSGFIDERLRVIEKELGVVDTEIMDFKSEHLVPDLEAAAKLSMEQDAEMTSQMLETTNQLAMATYVKDYLANPSNANAVIPVNTGVGSQQLEMQISTYNNVLLNRNNLVSASSEKNPLVQDYDAQLRGLREAIVRAVNAQVSALNTALSNMKGAKHNVQNQLASGPTQAKYLLSVERQQKVKEALYLYLLQKREENELTQKYNADNTRIITPPTGSLRPVAPKKSLIMIVAFMLGLCIPGVALYIAEATNTRVRGRKDLDRMSTPFAGEIPLAAGATSMAIMKLFRRNKRKGRHGRELEKVVNAVKEGSRDAVSESFRIVRGNIDFMLQKDRASNIIMVTSFNPGSGKSFIVYNLAASFALKGKRVLIVDCDLRHGSVSQFVGMPGKGLSNYLTGNVKDWKSLIVPVSEHQGVDVMPIGHRPPNPSELLDNGLIGQFLEEVKSDYDYVFVDCPPVDVVVDTQIVEKYVDRTLFVVRAGLLEKKSVVEIDQLYKNKRFKQMSIILNGTETRHSRHHDYGTYGYYGAD